MRRWELERGLPIHRVPGASRGLVYAFTDELEEWLRRRESQGEAAEDQEPAAAYDPSFDDAGTGDSAEESQRVLQQFEGAPDVANSQSRGETEHLGSSRHVLPWVVAVVLVLTVFGAVYSYRQTARFAARAAGERGAVATPHVPDAEAQDLYLKGRYYWSKRNPEDLSKAVDYFTQAIVKDPGYAAAFVGLADCYNLLREFGAMPADEAFPRALAAAQRAVELDGSSAEAHTSLAFTTFYWNWDAPTAEREFKRAIKLNPSFVRGHHWYATFLLAMDRFADALDQIEQAQKLDPSSTTILADKGLILWMGGRKQEGLALLKQLEGADPSLASTHQYLADIYLAAKDYRGWLAEDKRSGELRKDRGAIAVAEAADRGFAAGGIRGLHEAVLPVQEKLVAEGSGSAYELAVTCAALGRNEDALRYLQTAFDKHEIKMLFLDEHGDFPNLRDDPAYQQMVTNVKERVPQKVH